MKKRLIVLALITAVCLSMYTFAFSQEGFVGNQGFSAEPAFASEITSFPSTKYTGYSNITAYTSPDSSFDLTIQYLQSAEFEIDIEIYSISNGFLLEEIIDALGRNSSMVVRVIVSSTHASYFEHNWTGGALYNLSHYNSSSGYPGVELYESSNTFTFTHSKFIIIDREVVLVQSANWAKTGIPPDPSYGNREWGVVVKNQDVVDYFLDVFTNDVLIATPYTPDPYHLKTFSASISTGSYPDSPTPFSNQTFTGSMSIQPVLSPDNSNETIVQLLRSANNTLDVQQMYIKRYWDSGTDYFLEELVAAAARGVTVRVILDGDSSGMTEVAYYLTNNSVAVSFDNNTYFEWTHNKGVIVDGKVVLISSINWSHESVNENREAGVIIYSQSVASYFAQVFQWDWNVAEYLGGGTGGGLDIPLEYLAIGGVVGVIIIAVIAFFTKKK
ncbi:MAG: phosphatidylserine/phosphatidylglycerophosphate/cardiolipin synthase family protein [Candidatus Hodarchaeota archaeon]